MTDSVRRIIRKLFILGLLVGGYMIAAPPRDVSAAEVCIPNYNSCSMMCETVYGPYGTTPSEAGNAYCQMDCWSHYEECHIDPEHRDE